MVEDGLHLDNQDEPLGFGLIQPLLATAATGVEGLQTTVGGRRSLTASLTHLSIFFFFNVERIRDFQESSLGWCLEDAWHPGAINKGSLRLVVALLCGLHSNLKLTGLRCLLQGCTKTQKYMECENNRHP